MSRQVKPGELERTWICFDAPQNQACMRLSEFARMDASSELCENTHQKKSDHRIPCPDRLGPAPTTIPQNGFDTANICTDAECSQERSVAHYLRFLNSAVEARQFVQSGGPLIAGVKTEQQEDEESTGPAIGPTDPMDIGNSNTEAAPAASRAPAASPAPAASQAPAATAQANAPAANQAPASQAGSIPVGTPNPVPLASRAPSPSALRNTVETDFSLFG